MGNQCQDNLGMINEGKTRNINLRTPNDNTEITDKLARVIIRLLFGFASAEM